jgi:hypothetical protein
MCTEDKVGRQPGSRAPKRFEGGLRGAHRVDVNIR